MEIQKKGDGSILTVKISGRLDTVSALELDESLKLDGITYLTIDLADLEYIASAGLRLLLKMQKQMDKQGTMQIKNVRENIREVLDMTGFSNFLTIVDDKKPKFSVSF